jgi:tetratricopeptide (TPR) repeat protein
MFQRLLHRPDAVKPAALPPGQSGDKAQGEAAAKRSPRPSLWGRGLAALRRVAGAARRRPKTSAAVVVLLLAGAVGGLYGYALYEWQVAQAAVKKERIADAQAALRPCLLVWPYSARVHLLAARAARIKGEFAEAESQLNQCRKLDPSSLADVQLEFLLMRVQTGEEDEVAPDVIAYVDARHPDSALILETLARAYMTKLRYGPALAALERWIQEDPNSARAFHFRGWLLERLDNVSGALTDYERAVQLDPNLIAPRLQLANLYLERAGTDEARPHLQALLKQAPDRPEVQALQGRCLYMDGHGDKARPLLEAAVQKLPDNAPLLLTLANLDLEAGRPAQAEEWARRALKVDPTDTQARYALVGILRHEHREEDAAAALEQCEKDAAVLRQAEKVLKEEMTNPSHDPAAYYQMGSLFLRGGQDRVGEYYLQRALELDPRHQPTLKALAEFYEGKGDKERADSYRRQLTEPDKKAGS